VFTINDLLLGHPIFFTFLTDCAELVAFPQIRASASPAPLGLVAFRPHETPGSILRALPDGQYVLPSTWSVLRGPSCSVDSA